MIPLPDSNEIPAIGSPERSRQEHEVYLRATELIHENDGRLRDVLYYLEQELREPGRPITYPATVRDYARALVSYVEQCWATRIIE